MEAFVAHFARKCEAPSLQGAKAALAKVLQGMRDAQPDITEEESNFLDWMYGKYIKDMSNPDLPRLGDIEVDGKHYAAYLPPHVAMRTDVFGWYEDVGELPELTHTDEDEVLTDLADALGWAALMQQELGPEAVARMEKFWQDNPDGIIYFK